MKTLDLATKKVSKGTVSLITEFVYENRKDLSFEVLDFYNTVRGFIERELTKPSKYRKSMSEILEISYNIEQRILDSGAASINIEYIKL